MTTQEVDLRKTTSAVLKNFSPGFTDLIINILELRNSVMDKPDGNKWGKYADVHNGYGLMIIAGENNDNTLFTMTTEFLVPSNELAASFMMMWRKWCDKRGVNSKTGLLSLMNTVAIEMQKHITQDNQDSNSDLAIGLMGAVLDNYPNIISSMQWSVENGHAPCLIVANDNNIAKCAVCYGGIYMTPEMESQGYEA